MRGWPVVVAVVAALGLGVVTAVVVEANTQRPLVPGGPASAVDPQGLVGAWTATGPGVLDGKLLVLLPSGELRAIGDLCELMGSWSATPSGLAIVSIQGAGGTCRNDLPAAWAFFDGVQRYQLGENAAWLTDLAGVPHFALSPADASTWPNDGSGEADLATSLEGDVTPRPNPASLPSGVAPPTVDELTSGQWLPIETVDSDRWGNETRPQVSFVAGGRWSGSDGCNGLGGQWSIDPATGEWLAGSVGQTEIGCDNVDVSGMVGAARSVGIDAGELVFYDAEGSALGRFVRFTGS